jgi:hypothetical protein
MECQNSFIAYGIRLVLPGGSSPMWLTKPAMPRAVYAPRLKPNKKMRSPGL